MGHTRPLLRLFSFFSHNLYFKTVDIKGMRAQILRVEGEHADH